MFLFRCFEGCLKWFASGMGILLDVPEPENCDCMKEAEKVEKVKEVMEIN